MTLPAAADSGIEHIVVVMMENRSFDHFLGWLPGADGKQVGLTYTDGTGVPHQTSLLAPDYEGCGHFDPDHSYNGSRTAYDGGKMDGFLRAGNNDTFSIGYYTQPDLPFYSQLAQDYLVCDRYFASILGPTFPNRMFLWAAQTDRLTDSLSPTNLTTIFDRLSAAKVSHQYYFNNLSYLALWGLKYIDSSSLFSDFLDHASRGTLPSVSFVDPTFTILDDGTGNDDHPHADIRNGDAFLSRIFHTLAASPAWDNTVLIITFDEWGGFFDHVPPPRAPRPNNVDTDVRYRQVLLGFRVPPVIASPFTRNSGGAPQVTHTVFDHTSILKLIEWRWSLEPLTRRDASPLIGNLATSFNFQSPSSAVPTLPTPSTVFATPCFEGGIFNSGEPGTEAAINPWTALARTDAAQQWRQSAKFRQLF